MSWWRRQAGPSRADFTLDAEYRQFCLQDEKAVRDPSHNWTEEAMGDLLLLGPDIIDVGTMKDGLVRVEVAVTDTAPAIDLDGWNQVVDCSIEVPTGLLLVSGCMEPEPKRVRVIAGPYRARIQYGGLNMLEPDQGDDHYLVSLWPCALGPPHFLKRVKWPEEAGGAVERAASDEGRDDQGRRGPRR